MTAKFNPNPDVTARVLKNNVSFHIQVTAIIWTLKISPKKQDTKISHFSMKNLNA